MARSSFHWVGGLALVALLPACMKTYGADAPASQPYTASVAAAAPALGLRAQPDGADLMTQLAQRPSALVPGTPYAAVAAAVLQGSAFGAEAELRLAPLRGETEELSWLPELARGASLGALRDMSARIIARPERFDTSRKLAERDLAQAQIETAALALAEEANVHVHEALGQHLAGEEARARAALYKASYRDLAGLDWPISQAVASGELMSSELAQLRAEVADVRRGLAQAREAEADARRELVAMADGRLGGVAGAGALREMVGAVPLPLMQAQAARAEQEARQRLGTHAHMEGLQLRRSAEELDALEEAAGYAGEGAEAGDWGAPSLQVQWPERAAGSEAEMQIGGLARDRDRLRSEAAAAAAQASAAAEVAALALRDYRAGRGHAAQLLGPLERALDAQEAEITSRFALARTELDLAFLQGTLVAGSDL
ncbi:hypothetical protein AYJ57_06135 [Salipiger sp. CCB-MM3]|uniref:hypothetical protein n=1 Tax=Salipiger sp. CCB-MM3 TaxID=1792508 RepID=UPI00080A9AC5|nr:hypothetical protein [Salipiger sp. CCB-MM3]ANT59981.1 hypothetical protein AYJ57_06135 [Salipiger sp. CCB-MM3]